MPVGVNRPDMLDEECCRPAQAGARAGGAVWCRARWRLSYCHKVFFLGGDRRQSRDETSTDLGQSKNTAHFSHQLSILVIATGYLMLSVRRRATSSVMHMRAHTCAHMHARTCMRAHTCAHMHGAHACTHMHVHARTCTRVHAKADTCTCTARARARRARARTCTHARTQVRAGANAPSRVYAVLKDGGPDPGGSDSPCSGEDEMSGTPCREELETECPGP